MDAFDCLTRTLPSGARLVVGRFGGQVLSWQGPDGRERLYLSPLSTGTDKPVRGGVPVCFPQFSGRGPLAKHGFARTCWWTEVESHDPATLHLRLADDEATRRLWPHRFRLDLRTRLADDALEIMLDVANTDDTPWSFTAALHTYLAVDAVSRVRVEGLHRLTYEDTLRGGTPGHATEEAPALDQGIDRIYAQPPGPVRVVDGQRVLAISQQSFEDVVVWNPGASGGAAINDLPGADLPRFLCVEAAQVFAPVTLAPGALWSGAQRLRGQAAAAAC